MKLDLQTYSLESSKKITGPFINRERSWISFNARVLWHVRNKKIPIGERCNFLGITESNLDEFLSVRFSDAYKHQDEEPYEKILSDILSFKKAQEQVASELLSQINERYKVKMVKVKSLSDKDRKTLYDVYFDKIFPLLTPVMIDQNNYSPSIMSGQLCIAVTIQKGKYDVLCVIPINDDIPHIVMVDKHRFVLIEDIIMNFANKSLFVNETIKEKTTFRLVRDASIVLSHNSDKFIVDRMIDVINHRNTSEPIFMEIEDNNRGMKSILVHAFKVPNDHVYEAKLLLYKRFADGDFVKKVFPKSAFYEKFEPFVFENSRNYYSIFEALREQDILLHHPYDSYETVVKFIQHAAYDKNVLAIKQTLYRVSSIDSPIVEALCDAARNGKKVSVLIEIKARFDEQHNIALINKLKCAGATVLLGSEYLKTHCKMCLVIRQEKNDLRVYSHVGTGNYNEKTAKLYTDISFMTSKRKIGNDLLSVFNILSGHSRPDTKMEKIFYAPVNLRKTLERNIDREIHNAKNGKRAEIFIKVNSISDSIVSKLYKAADAGVKVYIIARGICSIVPRKNLYVKSIVGRFLEHSRIYYFYNGGKNSEYYISSADLLTRNLDKRIEVLISLKDSSVIEQVKWIMSVYRADRKNSFELNKDRKWTHMSGDFDSHQWFMDYSDVKKGKKKWRRK